MNGIKKAAVFLSSLDGMEADQLLCRLNAESARRVRREIMSLRHQDVSAETAQKLDEEFLSSTGWQPTHRYREHQFAAPEPAVYSPPQRPAVKYPTEVFVPPVRSFDFMKNWSVNDILDAIIDEHPQAITVVLAHLPQSKMKAILASMSAELQKEIKRRLEVYEMPDEQIIQEIESALRVRYRKQHRTVRQSPMLESFDDLETLNDTELAALFHSVDLTTAVLALMGAELTLITRVMKHFSPTEEHHMRKRLKQLRNINMGDIEQARQSILEQYHGTR